MRSKEEVLKDVKICLYSDSGHAKCRECSKHDKKTNSCGTDLIQEMIELLEEPMPFERDFKDGVKAGMEEAWELARIVCCVMRTMTFGELGHIFDIESLNSNSDILKKLSPNEVKQKLEAWAGYVCVGDEVIIDHNGILKSYAVVVCVGDDRVDVLYRNGVTATIKRSALTKTGKHIDLTELFKQIGE